MEEGYILCPQDLAGTTREAFSSSLTPGSGCWGSAFPVILVCRDWLPCMVMFSAGVLHTATQGENPGKQSGTKTSGHVQDWSRTGASQCHCRPLSVAFERLWLLGEALMAGKTNCRTHGKRQEGRCMLGNLTSATGRCGVKASGKLARWGNSILGDFQNTSG